MSTPTLRLVCIGIFGRVRIFLTQRADPLRLCHSGLMHYMHGVNPMNQLMKGDGSPTDLGYFYIDA